MKKQDIEVFIRKCYRPVGYGALNRLMIISGILGTLSITPAYAASFHEDQNIIIPLLWSSVSILGIAELIVLFVLFLLAREAIGKIRIALKKRQLKGQVRTDFLHVLQSYINKISLKVSDKNYLEFIYLRLLKRFERRHGREI